MSWPPFDSPCLTPPTDDAGPLGPCLHCQVRHLAVCSVLSPEEMHALDAAAGLQVLQPGTVLARQGEPRRHVFTVTRGALRLVRLSSDGRRQVAGFALPGDFVGLSGAATHPHDIEALGETELCRFSLDAMQRLGERFPHLQGKLLERACVELDSAHERMMSLARMNPTERMADFLVKRGIELDTALKLLVSANELETTGGAGMFGGSSTGVKISPHRGRYLYKMARIFYLKGEDEEAEKTIDTALATATEPEVLTALEDLRKDMAENESETLR